MDVFLDHQLFETDATDLTQILDQVKSTLAPSGRIVVEIRFDNQIADAQTLEQAHERLPEVQEINLISAVPSELCHQALQEVHACLDRILTHNKQASDLIHGDQTQEAMDHIGQSLEQWRQVLAAVKQTAGMLQIDLAEIATPDQTAAGLIQAIAEPLRQTQQHLIDQNHVGLADALQYEWDPIIEAWHTLIDALIQTTQAPR